VAYRSAEVAERWAVLGATKSNWGAIVLNWQPFSHGPRHTDANSSVDLGRAQGLNETPPQSQSTPSYIMDCFQHKPEPRGASHIPRSPRPPLSSDHVRATHACLLHPEALASVNTCHMGIWGCISSSSSCLELTRRPKSRRGWAKNERWQNGDQRGSTSFYKAPGPGPRGKILAEIPPGGSYKYGGLVYLILIVCSRKKK